MSVQGGPEKSKPAYYYNNKQAYFYLAYAVCLAGILSIITYYCHSGPKLWQWKQSFRPLPAQKKSPQILNVTLVAGRQPEINMSAETGNAKISLKLW